MKKNRAFIEKSDFAYSAYMDNFSPTLAKPRLSKLFILCFYLISAININLATAQEPIAADNDDNSKGYAYKYLQSTDKAGVIYHPYHFDNKEKYSPSPKGYKPVYISHYSRHGSRYHSSDRFFTKNINILKNAEMDNNLTETGKDLLKKYSKLQELHEGMYGELTKLGAKEHRGIAKRMYKRFANVFLKKKNIKAVSSYYSRCIMSMTNFCYSLKECDNKLNIDYDCGKKYYNMLMHYDGIDSSVFSNAKKTASLFRKNNFNPERLLKSIFVNPEKIRNLTNSEDAQSFAENLFLAGAICADLEREDLNTLVYFNKEEIESQWIATNNRFYHAFGNSLEQGGKVGTAAKHLVELIIKEADIALKDSCGLAVAADLRFAHDTGLLPLISFLSLEGAGGRYPAWEAHTKWNGSDNIPMGSNLQIIFYKKPKNNADILVKFLYNEKECRFSDFSTKSSTPPYYEWKELKEHLLNK